MRDALKDAVKDAICVECRLPHQESGIDKSCLSTQQDVCFRSDESQKVAHIIYNGIVEFAVNEYKINYQALELEQKRAIARYIRYNPAAKQETKLSYGFYGEVLFDLLLRQFMQTNVLIARGYFYSVLERGEPKGFDAFHLLERNDRLELWLGEAKFHGQYKKAITQVLEKLGISLSDEYLSRNLIALIDWQDKFTTPTSAIRDVLSAWELNPDINLANEMNNRKIRLIYPVFIAFQETDKYAYHENIKVCVDHIASEFTRLNISIPATFDYRLFFMFLPLSEVKKIKEAVLAWIESHEPLI